MQIGLVVSDANQNPKNGRSEGLTWAILLAGWTDFAKASVGLPDDGEAGRVKRAVPALIGLQAVACALAEVDQLSPKERAAGLDMGDVLIRQYAGQINEVWRGEAMPPGVEVLVRDARVALEAARRAGTGWILRAGSMVGQFPADLIEALEAMGFGGDVFVVSPGVRVFAGCPIAFVRDKAGPASAEVCGLVEHLLHEGVEQPSRDIFERVVQRGLRQAYRQFDFAKGGPVRDLVVGEDGLPAGQPLLVPAMIAGEALPVSPPIRGASAQAALPVEWDEGEGSSE